MPYFLEYATRAGAGRFTVEGIDFDHVLATAKKALHGMDCTRAALLHSADTVPVFGKGSVLAAYTRDDGWVTHTLCTQ